MKACVPLLLWLLLALATNAQPLSSLAQGKPCRGCCETPDQPDLLPILAPELAEQCNDCILLAVAQCPITEADIAAQQSILRYMIRLPDGTVVTALTPMTSTTGGWDLRLYPVGELAPPCDSGFKPF